MQSHLYWGHNQEYWGKNHEYLGNREYFEESPYQSKNRSLQWVISHPFSPFRPDAFSPLKAAFAGVGRGCLYLAYLLALGDLYESYVMGGKKHSH